jgi:F-type H+-transporting ATPase subunit c
MASTGFVRDAGCELDSGACAAEGDGMAIELMTAGLPLATLTLLGKSIGFGIAIGLAAFGTALGVGLIFASMLQSSARQPEASRELRPLMWIGFALTEAVVFYGLLGAMLLVFLI